LWSRDDRRNDWLRRLDRFRRNDSRRCVRRRLELYKLKTLSARTSTTTTTRRPWSTATFRVLTLEILRGKWIQNREDDYGMDKKRGGDTLPPPLSSARNTDRRPILICR
jgi:hypothetical protein